MQFHFISVKFLKLLQNFRFLYQSIRLAKILPKKKSLSSFLLSGNERKNYGILATVKQGRRYFSIVIGICSRWEEPNIPGNKRYPPQKSHLKQNLNHNKNAQLHGRALQTNEFKTALLVCDISEKRFIFIIGDVGPFYVFTQ